MSERDFRPAINKTGFTCPHCGIKAPQRWGQVYYDSIKAQSIPFRATTKNVEDARKLKVKEDADPEDMKAQIARLERMAAGEVFLVPSNGGTVYNPSRVSNVSIAQCGECGEISIWLVNQMIFPVAGEILPHDDLPENVQATFNEASKVLSVSPRASAALARLALQELCVSLDTKSNNLNLQIGELVKRGLDPDIAKMLDAIRVIGNNAVHPLTIDMSDDAATAAFLLSCINRICQRLITEKREAGTLFEMLPPGAKAAIAKRDESPSDA